MWSPIRVRLASGAAAQPPLSQEQIQSELMDALGGGERHFQRAVSAEQFLNALGDTPISRPTLEALKEALGAAGATASGLLESGLPSAIKALKMYPGSRWEVTVLSPSIRTTKGKISEQQLLHLATIAKTAGKESSDWFKQEFGGDGTYRSDCYSAPPQLVRALGGRITEKHLGDITTIIAAQKAAQNHLPSLGYWLNHLSACLGGKVTEQQLEVATEVARASSGHFSLSDIAGVVGALGGKITDRKFSSVGKKLIAIAESVGQDNSNAMRWGIPKIIRALGDRITEQQLGLIATITQRAAGNQAGGLVLKTLPCLLSGLTGEITDQQFTLVGDKVLAIAKASGENAEAVLESLPAVVDALGGKTTPKQLDLLVDIIETAGNKAGTIVAVLPEALKRLDSKNADQELRLVADKIREVAEIGDLEPRRVFGRIKALDRMSYAEFALTTDQIVTIARASSGEDLLELLGALKSSYSIKALLSGTTTGQLGPLLQYLHTLTGEKIGYCGLGSAIVRGPLADVVEAIHGPISEKKLISTGDKLLKIGKAAGANCYLDVLSLGIPSAINALGGKISEPQLLSIGMEMAATANATGKATKSDIFARILPEIYQALGGKITEEQLMQLLKIAQSAGVADAATALRCLPALLEAASTTQTSTVLTSALGYWQGKDPATLVAGDTVELVSRLAKLVWHSDQRFSSPKMQFTTRIKEWRRREITPVLTLPGVVRFDIKVKESSAQPYLINGKAIEKPLFDKYREHFSITAEKRTTALSSLAQIAGLPLKEIPKSGSKAELELTKSALLKAQQAGKLPGALKSVRGLLPEMTGMRLTPPSGYEPLELRRFYQSLQNALEGHIPETLQSWGITLAPQTKAVFIDNYLSPVRGELAKFADGQNKREFRTVQVVATKSVYDAFYDAIGENCSGGYGFELNNPIFQPLRLIEPGTGEHYGVVYALKGLVEGRRALVLAGVEIRKQYAYGIKQSEFVPALIEQLGKIAKHNGFQEIVATVGDAKNGQPWSDDGRIAQYDVTREALCGMGNKFQDLVPEEQIHFPKTYHTPIKRVLKVWDAQSTK